MKVKARQLIDDHDKVFALIDCKNYSRQFPSNERTISLSESQNPTSFFFLHLNKDLLKLAIFPEESRFFIPTITLIILRKLSNNKIKVNLFKIQDIYCIKSHQFMEVLISYIIELLSLELIVSPVSFPLAKTLISQSFLY